MLASSTAFLHSNCSCTDRCIPLRHPFSAMYMTAFPITRADSYIAVALVVFKQNVILRGVLLDKATFKNERLKLAVRDDIFKIIDIINHSANLFGMVILRTEVLADSVLRAFALPIYIIFPLLSCMMYTPGNKGSAIAFLRSCDIFGFTKSPPFTISD